MEGSRYICLREPRYAIARVGMALWDDVVGDEEAAREGLGLRVRG
jgi:hypothetical protein